MEHLLITTIVAVLLVGCGKSQPTEPPIAKAPDISIHDAAKIGNIEAIKQHIGAGTEVNAKNKGGGIPLYSTVWNVHKEIAELLIANGADVDANYHGNTVLCNATINIDWILLMF